MTASWPNRVAIGGFVADNNDTDFRVTAKVTGWGTPPVRLTVDDRAQQDGGWDSTPLYSSRAVTIEGAVVQPSSAAAQTVADTLCALPLGSLLELVVVNDDVGTRSSWVRVEVGADPEWVTPTRFNYALQLRAPDPVKYGPIRFAATVLSSATPGAGLVFPLAYPLDYGVAPGTTPGVVSVPNVGTTSYFPRVRIDGPVTNPAVTLAETGDQVRFSGTVGAGQWLDIDTRQRRVLLNGLVSQRHKVSFTGAWLAVPRGGGSLSWTADTADPVASLSVWAYEGAWL